MSDSDLNFDSPDLEKIERIIALKVASQIYGVDLGYTDADLSFMNDLTDADKNRIERVARSRVRNMSESDLTAMRDEDQFYYDNLSQEEKERLEAIINRYLQSADSEAIFLDQDDQEFYSTLSTEEQEKVYRLIASRLQKDGLEPDIQFDSPDLERIERIISLKVAAALYGVELAFTDEDLKFYQNLSQADKDRIERVVKSRIRNLSESDLIAMRDEDEFFYDNLDQGGRENFQGMVATYIKENGLSSSIFFDEEDQQFYNSLNPEEKEKLDRLIAHRIQNATGESFYGETPEEKEFYEKLPLEKKQRINRLAKAFITQKVDFLGLQLAFADKNFYASLSNKEKPLALGAIRNRMMKQYQEDNFTIQEEDRTYYQQMTPPNKELLDRVASALIVSDFNSISKNLSKEDLKAYENLPSQEKAKFDKVLATRIRNVNAGDQFYLQSLDPESARNVDQIAQIYHELQDFNELELQLSPELASFYDQFSGEDKSRIQRIITARSRQKPTEAFVSFSETETPTSRGDVIPETLIQSDIGYYLDLPESEKKQIDRIVAMNIAAQAYRKDERLKKDDLSFYSGLQSSEKQSIDRIGKYLASSDNSNIYFIDSDQSYYQFMSPEKREKVNRLIVLKGFNKERGQIELSNQDKLYLRKLTNRDLARIHRIIEVRKANSRILGGDLELDYQALKLADVEARINTFNTQDYDRVTVTGKLINILTGFPAAEVEIPLLNDKNEVVKITSTDSQGRFKYSNLPANQNFRIIAEDKTTRITDVEKFFIKDLEVKGSRIIAGKISYENVYFDFNSYSLRSEAIKVLDELVTLSKRYPEMQIEVNAFTDFVGSSDYNLWLSEKRGRTVFEYLVKRGMSRTSLVINARGKASPVASNDNPYGRQLNRRVEFLIYGDVTYTQEYVTFIVRPKTTLFSIANAFAMSVEELIRINGLKSNLIEAYTPIRVRKSDKEIDYTLVFEGSASFKGYQKYKVRQGESVYSIAEKFKIPEELLMEINGLSNAELKAGQTLNVYIQ